MSGDDMHAGRLAPIRELAEEWERRAIYSRVECENVARANTYSECAAALRAAVARVEEGPGDAGPTPGTTTKGETP